MRKGTDEGQPGALRRTPREGAGRPVGYTGVFRLTAAGPHPGKPGGTGVVEIVVEPRPSPLVIVVRPGSRTRTILGWLRQLVPAALLVVAAADLPPPTPPEAIVLDEEEVASGPLSLADALTRHRASGARPATPSGTSDE